MRIGIGIGLGFSSGVLASSILLDQSFAVSIGGGPYAPIVMDQPTSVVITGAADSLTPAQLRLEIDAASITLGTTMRASGTTPPVVLLAAGSQSLTFGAGLCPGFWVDILTGALTFDLSFNSGATIAFAAQTIPVGGGDYTIPSGTYAGMVITFPLGTYNADNRWEGVAATVISTEGQAYSFTQATASAQPVFRDAAITPDGKDALFFAGAQWMSTTNATVKALLTNDPALTVIGRIAYTTVDAVSVWFGAADSTESTNRKRRYGQSTTGAGREALLWANNAGSTTTHFCATDPLTGGTAAHNVCWHTPGSNGTMAIAINGTDETLEITAANISTLTPTRVAIGCDADVTPGQFFNGYIYDLAVFSSDLSAGDRTAWNTAMA